MTLVGTLMVALGAAAGAPTRFVLASRLDAAGRPAGTFAVNVVGSFLLGLFSAWALSTNPAALLGTGFCGGLTTYSAFAVQTVGLGPARGLGYAVLTIGLAVAACTLGFVLG